MNHTINLSMNKTMNRSMSPLNPSLLGILLTLMNLTEVARAIDGHTASRPAAPSHLADTGFGPHQADPTRANNQAGPATGQVQPTPVFKNEVYNAAYTHYTALKEALVLSNQAAAKSAAASLAEGLNSVENGANAHLAASLIVKATSLEAQRKAFTDLTTEMIHLSKSEPLASGELHLAYCPMANGNKGGYWLSNTKDIRNPYYGDRMLRCGSVKETIIAKLEK